MRRLAVDAAVLGCAHDALDDLAAARKAPSARVLVENGLDLVVVLLGLGLRWATAGSCIKGVFRQGFFLYQKVLTFDIGTRGLFCSFGDSRFSSVLGIEVSV